MASKYANAISELSLAELRLRQACKNVENDFPSTFKPKEAVRWESSPKTSSTSAVSQLARLTKHEIVRRKPTEQSISANLHRMDDCFDALHKTSVWVFQVLRSIYEDDKDKKLVGYHEKLDN